VPRTAEPAVRLLLIARAAAMLAAREPVTLRSLVEGTGASTMAVYTHFGGMPQLWQAVRHEGFVRLAARLAALRPTPDPVRDLGAACAAYLEQALSVPDLYRAMFDTHAELLDASVADAGFSVLVQAVARCRDAGRLVATTEPHALATTVWATGHGFAMLAIGGVLPAEAAGALAPTAVVALLQAAGDEPARCDASVRQGWYG